MIPTFPLFGRWHIGDGPLVPGTLTMEESGALRLELTGPIWDVMFEFFPVNQRITGIVGGTPATVERAHLTYQGAGHDQRWHAYLFVFGANLSEVGTFRSVHIESIYATLWWEKRLTGPPTVEATQTQMPALTILPAGKASIWERDGQTWGFLEFSVTRRVVFSLEFDEAANLLSCLELVSSFINLLDFVFGMPTSVTQVALTITQGSDERPPETAYAMGTFASPKLSEPESELSATAHGRSLTFDEFGGQTAVALWMLLDRPLQRIAGRAATQYRSEGRYIEDSALAAFATAEGLDRILSKAKNTTARGRLRRLAGALPEFVSEYLGGETADDWAHKVVSERDRIAHLLEDVEDDAAHIRLMVLARSVHVVTVLTLFRLAGIQEHVRAKMVRHSRMAQWAREYHDAMHP